MLIPKLAKLDETFAVFIFNCSSGDSIESIKSFIDELNAFKPPAALIIF